MEAKSVLIKIGTDRATRVAPAEARAQIASGAFTHSWRRIINHRNHTETVLDVYSNVNGQQLATREKFAV